MLKKWQKFWDESFQGSHFRQVAPCVDVTPKQHIKIGLERRLAVPLTRLRLNHFRSNHYKYVYQNGDNKLCQLCLKHTDTRLHLLAFCEAISLTTFKERRLIHNARYTESFLHCISDITLGKVKNKNDPNLTNILHIINRLQKLSNYQLF